MTISKKLLLVVFGVLTSLATAEIQAYRIANFSLSHVEFKISIYSMLVFICGKLESLNEAEKFYNIGIMQFLLVYLISIISPQK